MCLIAVYNYLFFLEAVAWLQVLEVGTFAKDTVKPNDLMGVTCVPSSLFTSESSATGKAVAVAVLLPLISLLFPWEKNAIWSRGFSSKSWHLIAILSSGHCWGAYSLRYCAFLRERTISSLTPALFLLNSCFFFSFMTLKVLLQTEITNRGLRFQEKTPPKDKINNVKTKILFSSSVLLWLD